MPGWIETGYQEYSRRLGRDCRLQLRQLPTSRRSQHQSASEVVRQDGERLLAALPGSGPVVALDEKGASMDSAKLARRFRDWMENHNDVSLLIGGADGLSGACLEQASERWSLSPLTFPHGLVRVVVAEQIYRAYSLYHNHPYHRS